MREQHGLKRYFTQSIERRSFLKWTGVLSLLALSKSKAAWARARHFFWSAPTPVSTALYNELYRPQFHFSPAGNWINDPNGLVYYQGEYHLFYQYNPDSNGSGPKHWGHSVGTDLVHWNDLPIALDPDAQGDIWSGSAVVDWNNTSGFFPGGSGLVAIYTAAATVPQQQSIAYSSDRGRTWTKYAGNPVIANPGLNDFRDPKVFWYAPTSRWIMIVAGGNVHFYSSPDLKNWTLESQLNYNTECPCLFALPINGNTSNVKWVMSMGGVQYYLGSFDGHNFTTESGPFTTDYGADFYAAQSWSDIPAADGRCLWLGWMSTPGYAEQLPTYPWRGTLTEARSLTLLTFPEGVRLVQNPVVELASLHGQHFSLTSQTLSPGNNPLASINGDALDISATFTLGTASSFGFNVRVGGSQQTTIGYDVNAGTLFVDRTQSGDSSFNGSFAAKHTAPLTPVNGTISIRILVDRSSVEVFGNNGKVVITDQIFPSANSTGLILYASGGNVTLNTLDLYQMNPTWSAPSSALTNGNFHTGDLTGWSVISGTAFSNSSVTDLTNAYSPSVGGNGDPFNQNGTYHLWGYQPANDPPTGLMISQIVTLGDTGIVDFQIGGGNDLTNLYVALARASDGTELFKATGQNAEGYRRVVWDASKYIGTAVYFKVVDNSTGDWGHHNLADVHLPGTLLLTTTGALVNPDFETGDLTGWAVLSGTAFSNAAVSNLNTANSPNFGGSSEVFHQHGTYHVWGFQADNDSATGLMVSQAVKLGGNGQVSLWSSGGNDIASRYVALVRALDGAELFKVTGQNTETYQQITWDASAYIGTSVYIKLVDTATGGWGHINIDNVSIPTS